MSQKNFNVPNTLTFLRIIAIPFLFWLILTSKNAYAIVLFVLILTTDFLDGYLARRLKQKTRLGSILDPIADKFFYASVLFGVLIKNNMINWIIFFSIVSLLYILAYLIFIKKKIKVSYLGKVFVVLDLIVLFALLLGMVNDSILILFAVLLSIPALDYILKMMKRKK
jgi:cardiolipin synthase